METVYFVTLSEEQNFQVEAATVSPESIDQGFMHGAIFIEPWTIGRSRDEALQNLARVLVEVGATYDFEG